MDLPEDSDQSRVGVFYSRPSGTRGHIQWRPECPVVEKDES